VSATLSSSALEKRLKACRAAARALRQADATKKNTVLYRAAELLAQKQKELLKANAADLRALGKKSTPAFKDRLTITEARIGHMAESLRQVAELSDPVGEEVEAFTLPNGLNVRRVRSPLGVIYMIFESRPNVAIEAFSLGFKSGNVMILRGGKESMKTTAVLYSILQQSLKENGLSTDCLWGVTSPDRKLAHALLQQKKWIDVVVPRGGDGLIEFVTKHSQIPVIKNDRGLCHIYVHEDANLDMALGIVENAKVQRPGVCNSMETLLVHRSVSAEFLTRLYDRISTEDSPHTVYWYGDRDTLKILKGQERIKAATPKSWDTEYLDYKMNCRVVDSLDEAIEHIETHGSRHSEAIITASSETARTFEQEVDAAAVYWNGSTRFTDGFELGLGGELGISTQKLHVRGPVGLRELTSVRWIIEGQGQVRQSK